MGRANGTSGENYSGVNTSLWGVQFSPLGGSAISRLNDQDLRVLVADHGA
jgi:hypothetical protein